MSSTDRVTTIHLTSTSSPGRGDELDDQALVLLDRCREVLAEHPSRFEHVSDAADAKFIVLIEPPRHKFASYAEVLLSSEVVPNFPERCFVYDWADGAAGFLPGVYSHLGRSQWDPARCVPGPYLRPYNAAVASAAQYGSSRTGSPRWMLSFRGSMSHNLRRRIAETPSVVRDPEVEFAVTDQWFTHTSEEQWAYADSILDSRFILCPRGVSPGSYRIYEAMALGRAPVIVSDEWLAPAGPDWASFSLVVNEARIGDLTDIVRRREHDWEEMGRLARRAWEEFFSLPNALHSTLRSIELIELARPRGETLAELKARWSSRRFKLEHDWATSQKLGRILTSPDARQRLLRRIAGSTNLTS